MCMPHDPSKREGYLIVVANIIMTPLEPTEGEATARSNGLDIDFNDLFVWSEDSN